MKAATTYVRQSISTLSRRMWAVKQILCIHIPFTITSRDQAAWFRVPRLQMQKSRMLMLEYQLLNVWYGLDLCVQICIYSCYAIRLGPSEGCRVCSCPANLTNTFLRHSSCLERPCYCHVGSLVYCLASNATICTTYSCRASDKAAIGSKAFRA